MAFRYSSISRATAGVFGVYGTLIAASIVAMLIAGCAHSPTSSVSDRHTTGAVPRDAWGNPIFASAATSASTNFAR